MAVFSLFCTFLPLIVGLLAMAVPAVIDLVMRKERVPVWWAAPLVLFVPFALMALILPAAMDPGMGRAYVPMFGWGMLHMAAAGMLLALASGLAFARGLRPGGETLRRRRTSLAAILALLGLMIVPWLPGLLPLLWVVPPAWAGLFWVIALNRRGPMRLERGKSVSASMLFASALSFLIGVAHFIGALRMANEAPDIPWYAWLASLAVLTGLAGCLRWLTGPPAPAPLLAAAASGITLLFPLVWSLAFWPVPGDIQAPRWVDLEGRRGGDALEGYETYTCLKVIDAAGTVRGEGPRCNPYGSYSTYNDALLVDARTPLSKVTDPSTYIRYLVESGRYHTDVGGRWGDPVVVASRNGKVRLGSTPSTGLYPDLDPREYTLGPELGDAIRHLAGDDSPVHVEMSPDWTMQDFISMCASLRTEATCQLVPVTSDPPPPR